MLRHRREETSPRLVTPNENVDIGKSPQLFHAPNRNLITGFAGLSAEKWIEQ